MKYILYARKSTEEDDRQVLSIEAQLVELQEYAAKEKLEIVASFQEAKTAKEPGRTKFAEMLSFLEIGKADGILAWHPDRLARNSIDGGQIIHLIDRGLIRSLKFPTFWFEPTPQGLFMLNIAFGQSKYFVDNLRENVKRGLRQKIRNGTWPGWAPVGYLNNPKTRGIDMDPDKVPKVRKLFELYATGKYPLHSLANWCEKHDLRGNLGKEIALSNLQSILQNIFYLGLMKWKGEVFEGKHEPLISKKLFDKVQEVMARRGKVRPDRHHDFAFLGLLKCASCGCSITAQYAKGNGGIYTYYRCTKKRGACTERYISETALAGQIKSFLQKVSLSSQDTKKVLVALEQDEAQAKENAKSEATALKVQIVALDGKLEKLLDAFLSDALSTTEYAAKKNRLVSEKVRIEEKISDIEQRGVSWLEPAREFVLSLNQAANLLSQNNLPEMAAFLKNIGANHILQNRQFVFEPKMQYALTAERSEAAISNLQFPEWCPRKESNLDREIRNLIFYPLNYEGACFILQQSRFMSSGQYIAKSKTLTYHTKYRLEFITITDELEKFVAESGVKTGTVTLQTHHTTCGVWVNENEKNLIGPAEVLGCTPDLKRILDRFADPSEEYGHNDICDTNNPEGKRNTHLCAPDENGVINECINGHAHAQALLLPSYLTLIVERGRLLRGTWQQVLLVELDHDRERKVTFLVQGVC